MAEACIVKADYSVKVPDGLDSAAASSITCAGVTTYKAVKISNIRPGQWIAIYGLGGLGNLALQYAKNVFNAKVIAVDVNEEQLRFASEMGADLVINPSAEDAAKVIKPRPGRPCRRGYRGRQGRLRLSRRRPARRWSAGCGGAAIGSHEPEYPRLVLDGIEVIGSLVGTRQDLQEAFQFAAEGKVVPKVTLRPIEDINQIFDEMLAGKIKGRMVINFEG